MAKISTNPTTEQIQWLKENFQKARNTDIADRYTISPKRAAEWLNLLGLIKERRVYSGRKKIGKQKRKFESRQIEHLSDEYSNLTREQYVERILSIQI